MTPPHKLKTSKRVELEVTEEREDSNCSPAKMRREEAERPRRIFKDSTESLEETWETRVFPLTVLTKICISVNVNVKVKVKGDIVCVGYR